MTTSSLRAPVGVGLMFSSNGAVMAGLLPWYPLLTRELGLGPAEFGLVLACMPAGSLLSSALPAPLIARWGTRPVSLVSTLVLLASLCAAPWSPNGWVLAACLFTAGFSDAAADVAQNVAAVRVQATTRRPIIGSMHAMWSLGAAACGAATTAVAVAGGEPRLHLLVVAAVSLALLVLGLTLTGPTPAAPRPATTQPTIGGSRRTRILVLVLPLAVVAICGTAVEDVANNWAALAAVDLTGLPVTLSGIALTAALTAQTLGRFSGDLLVHRWGRGSVARAGGGVIALGGVLMATATGPVQLCLGFACAGWGCATLVPSAFAAAGNLPGVSDGAGITVVGWMMRLGFLATSPLVGGIGSTAGLRWALGLVVLAGLVTVLLGGRLDPHRSPDTT